MPSQRPPHSRAGLGPRVLGGRPGRHSPAWGLLGACSLRRCLLAPATWSSCLAPPATTAPWCLRVALVATGTLQHTLQTGAREPNCSCHVATPGHLENRGDTETKVKGSDQAGRLHSGEGNASFLCTMIQAIKPRRQTLWELHVPRQAQDGKLQKQSGSTTLPGLPFPAGKVPPLPLGRAKPDTVCRGLWGALGPICPSLASVLRRCSPRGRRAA